MNFDLRLPVGLMFSVYGVILVILGVATEGGQMYTEHSLGININLVWGVVLLSFGSLMLAAALRGRNKS